MCIYKALRNTRPISSPRRTASCLVLAPLDHSPHASKSLSSGGVSSSSSGTLGAIPCAGGTVAASPPLATARVTAGARTSAATSALTGRAPLLGGCAGLGGGQRPSFFARLSPSLLPPVSPLHVVTSMSAVGLPSLAHPAGCSDGFDVRRFHGGCAAPLGDADAVVGDAGAGAGGAASPPPTGLASRSETGAAAGHKRGGGGRDGGGCSA